MYMPDNPHKSYVIRTGVESSTNCDIPTAAAEQRDTTGS